jgi:hypothetical protein
MMLKKIYSAILAALLLQAAALPAFAKTNAERDAQRAGKVRTQLSKLGTGADAQVSLELRDRTKLEGHLSEAGPDSFTVTDKEGKSTTVPYQDVKRARGNNLSTGAKVAIGVGVGAAVTLIILWSLYAANER